MRSGTPDFFIVGAPKCGTTAMTDYLRQHPDVGTVLKEAHYFGSDLPLRQRPQTESEYLARFGAVRGGKRGGDASVFYLYSKCAAQEVKAFEPEARIIVMLRNPVDMLHSLHAQLVFIDSEDITDFEAALDADADRLNGRRLPRNRILAQAGYRNIARYTEQVQRYYDAFGRDRVHTVIYDDFARDALKSYERVREFLELDPGASPVVRVVNPNKVARSTRVRRLVEFPSTPMRRIVRAVVPTTALRRRAAAGLKSLNTRYEARAPMAPELRARLSEEFTAEVTQLSELLGRDLTDWCRPAVPSVATR